MKNRKHKQHGYTLIELMVVVVIIGVLGALVVPNFMNRPNEARQAAAKTDIASLMNALKLYKLDNHRYPDAETGLKALATPINGRAAYIDKLPLDPWKNQYQYMNPGVYGEVDVFSFGADGKTGGEAGDADIGSWQ